MKWLIILGVIVGGGYAASAPVAAWLRERAKVKYTTATVTRGRVETVVNSTGTVKPVRSVSIGAFVSGPIAEIYVDYNSIVKKGDLLALIDPRLLSAARDRDLATVATQKADLKRVEALLQQAKNNENRGRKLMAVNKDYLSEVDLDQYVYTRLSLEAQKVLAEANIQQAEASLKNSQANYEYTRITSPVDGIVIERKVDPGQTVAASFQTPELFVLAPDMDKHMHVYASVDEADIGLIRAASEAGRAVTFTVDAYPRDLFPGKIYQIRKSSTTTQNVVTYPVVVEAANPELKLMPGMTASLTFQVEAKETVLRVPASALRFVPPAERVREEDKHYVEAFNAANAEAGRQSAADRSERAGGRQKRVVWAQDGDLLRAIPLTLGLIENLYSEVVGGDLAEGQALVSGIEGVTK